MQNKRLKLSCILLSAASIAVFAACGNGNGNGNEDDQTKLYQYETYAHFNYAAAQWAFTKKTDETDEATWAQIRQALTNVEQSVSVSDGKSAIAKFNAADAGAKIEVDQTAYDLLTLAKDIYEKTDGAYNPAVGNLIDLWGFSPRFSDSSNYEPQYPYDRKKPNEVLPDAEYVESFLSLSDFSQVILSEEDGKYYVLKPDCKIEEEYEGQKFTYTMQLNLGGIGKGYAVDEADRVIRAAGYEYGYFNLGGSSMTVLKDPREEDHAYAWEIGVVNPRREINNGNSFMSVIEKDICLSSSGDYNQYYELDGKRYSHIINPKTGYPVNSEPENGNGSGIVCASVFGLSAAEGDATTTALMVMGKEKAIEYISEYLSGVDVCFVYAKGDGSYALYTNMNEQDYKIIDGIETVKL